MEKAYDFDLTVIGAGPGGYEAAFYASDLGMKVAIVEKDEVGGTCLNRGCIPTKAIMRATGIYREAKEAAFLNGTDGVSADREKIFAGKDESIDAIRSGLSSSIDRHGIEKIEGLAKITDEHVVTVSLKDGSTREVTSKFILVATGSHPFVPPIEGADGEGVVTSDDMFTAEAADLKDIAIIGGGAIGIEFAMIFRDLGAEVTVIEALDRLIPTMDKELGRSLKMNLQGRGIDVHTGAKVEKIGKKGDRLLCTFSEKDKAVMLEVDKVLISTGRRATTEGLFADRFGHLLDRGLLKVNENYATEVGSIYGIGDVIGGITLAHVASAEGINAVAHMNGAGPVIDMRAVPGCIYTEPEIASVGMTQDEAKSAGIDVVTKKFPMTANGKTVIEGLGRGFIKLVARKEDGVLIGAQLMCGRATDMVSELGLAIVNELTLQDVAKTIHPHPTFAEAIAEAARIK